MNYKTLIMLIYIVVLAIIAASLLMGIKTREATVVEHPFEAGLKYDSMQKKYAELGWKVEIPPSLGKDGFLSISIHDSKNAPVDDVSVEFVLNRFGSPDIKKYRAKHTDRGVYGTHVVCPLNGYWALKVNVTLGNDTLSYESKIRIEK